jgi:hypothetical protein
MEYKTVDHKKKNVSFRLTSADLRKIKEISNRLGVKESDLYRFSVKNMLTKLMPLHDRDLRGADLIPALLECGEDLLRYFDLDAEQLDHIINDGIDDATRRVDTEDLDLLALAIVNGNYVINRLSELCREPVDLFRVNDALRQYLQEKYLGTQFNPYAPALEPAIA